MENNNKKAMFMSVSELAKVLGISRVAVFNKIKKGKIPAQKIGRSYAISVEDVSHLIHDTGEVLLTDDRKKEIKEAVEKVVKEYGDTLKLLGKE